VGFLERKVSGILPGGWRHPFAGRARSHKCYQSRHRNPLPSANRPAPTSLQAPVSPGAAKRLY